MLKTYKRAKKFVQENQMLVACTATAVVTVVVTRKFDTKIFSDFAYEKGAEAGKMAMEIDRLQYVADRALYFIEGRNLVEEFREAVAIEPEVTY